MVFDHLMKLPSSILPLEQLQTTLSACLTHDRTHTKLILLEPASKTKSQISNNDHTHVALIISRSQKWFDKTCLYVHLPNRKAYHEYSSHPL